MMRVNLATLNGKNDNGRISPPAIEYDSGTVGTLLGAQKRVQ